MTIIIIINIKTKMPLRWFLGKYRCLRIIKLFNNLLMFFVLCIFAWPLVVLFAQSGFYVRKYIK